MQKPDRQLILDVGLLENFAELFERYALIAILIGLHYRTIGDVRELLVRDVRAHHHVQNGQQFVFGDLVVRIQIVNVERVPQLIELGVQSIFIVLFRRTKSGQHLHELSKIDALVVRLVEKRLDNTFAKRIDGQLRYS